MRIRGVEDKIAGWLLTDKVRAVVAGLLAEDGFARLQWRSWPQLFPSTTGPWPGVGGRAVTTAQVTTAHYGGTNAVLVFVGDELFAFGESDDPTLWQQLHSGSIDFGRLATRGLTIMRRGEAR